MGPTDKIREWLEQEEPEIRNDIAFLTTMVLVEDAEIETDSEKASDQIIRFLTPGKEGAYRTLGKALGFIAVFEHLFSDRFTEDGWTRTRDLHESLLEGDGSEVISPIAKRFLDDLPRRIPQWEGVGQRWANVRAKLSRDQLERWALNANTR